MNLKKEKLRQVLKRWSADGLLYVPDNALDRFVPYTDAVDIDLSAGNTKRSPKDIFFPKVQEMYRYERNGLEVKVEETGQTENIILFGVRPCDAAAISRLDQVFLEGPYVDSLYARNREHLTIVAVGCGAAGETCFCTSMGINPAAAPEADIELIPGDGGFNIRVNSSGEQLLQGVLPLMDEGVLPLLPGLSCTLETGYDNVAVEFSERFEDPLWDEIWRPCLGCGICTYLCPTCFCFALCDEDKGEEGVALRHWDSCMFLAYSQMAGGHDPRPHKKERVRNRFMHKLSYFYERYNTDLCVGCGRCVENCPVGVNIISTIKRFGEGERR